MGLESEGGRRKLFSGMSGWSGEAESTEGNNWFRKKPFTQSLGWVGVVWGRSEGGLGAGLGHGGGGGRRSGGRGSVFRDWKERSGLLVIFLFSVCCGPCPAEL